jgi:PAS domain S-box-containing protein
MPDIYQKSSITKVEANGTLDNAVQDNDQQSFKFLLEDSPVAIYTCDRKGYITYFNQAAVRLWGNTPRIGEDLWCGSWKIYNPDGSPMPLSECPMARTLQEGRAFENEEITIETPDHVFKRLLVFPRPIYDHEHNLVGAHNTLIDISDKVAGESRQAVLSAIVESSDDAIISKNLNSIIMSWNAGAQRIFEYTEAEVLGKSITILIPPNRLNEEENILRQIRSGQKVDHFETIRISKSGREIPLSITVSPVKDSLGNIIGASKIARDISDQIAAKRAIQRNAENLELLNSAGKVILGTMDVDSLLQQVTDATTKITGATFGAFFYNTVDTEGDPFVLFTLSGAPKSAFENFGMPRQTGIFRPTFTEGKVVRLDDVTKSPHFGKVGPHHGMPEGHLHVVSYLAVPVSSSAGEVIGALIFGHPDAGVFKSEHEDIVGSIAAQAAIALENSRLFQEVSALSAKKDEFIALASHELKTPLTTIKGYLQILAKKDQDTVGKLFVDKTLDQVGKLNSLIGDLLDISKIEAGKLQFNFDTFDLRKLVIDVLDTFPYTNKSHRIILEDIEEEFIILADKQRIEQVIINLLTNAIKYSPKADQVLVGIQRADGEVIVKIKDHGIGLKPADINKIFTRFYRADGIGSVSGLGIGLHLTKEIIDRHEGKIGVVSEFGKGSEFFFSLPLKN